VTTNQQQNKKTLNMHMLESFKKKIQREILVFLRIDVASEKNCKIRKENPTNHKTIFHLGCLSSQTMIFNVCHTLHMMVCTNLELPFIFLKQ
jgi:hypothetical protein